MNTTYRIYLDACCLNRPFDDQTQPRIHLETQAILTILSQCESGVWSLMTSTALDRELDQTPNLERRQNVKSLLKISKIKVNHSLALEERSETLQTLGFTSFDATHVASAEKGLADVFLSTDDRLLKKAQRYSETIRVAVNNPVQWLMQTTQDNNHHG